MNNKNTYNFKMLGLVTLYNAEPQEATANIKRYIGDIDALIIWDNSPLEKNLQKQVLGSLANETEKIIWHGDGQNCYIAPAINYAWHYADEHGFDLILLMDQDSQWENFPFYRKKVEEHFSSDTQCAFTPYIAGGDKWPIVEKEQLRRVFITSGTVLTVKSLNAIDGADLKFPLDALDHDISIRLQKASYKIISITCCILYHTIGTPRRSKYLKFYTLNYSRERIYSITRSHLLKLRKHWDWFTYNEKLFILKTYFVVPPILMITSEADKIGRLRMFFKGIKDGIKEQLR